MAALTLKSLLNPKSETSRAVAVLVGAMGDALGIEDASGQLLVGTLSAGPSRVPVTLEDATLGWVTGPPALAVAAACLLTHLVAKESERRALAGEVLHFYREVHLIEHLSEQLAAMLDLSAVGQSALDQARRLIAGIARRRPGEGRVRWPAPFRRLFWGLWRWPGCPARCPPPDLPPPSSSAV